MRRVIKSDTGHSLYSQRKHTIEPIFGQIKHNRRIARFQRRGITACRSEWRLIATTHNILKLWRANNAPATPNDAINNSPHPSRHPHQRRQPEKKAQPTPRHLYATASLERFSEPTRGLEPRTPSLRVAPKGVRLALQSQLSGQKVSRDHVRFAEFGTRFGTRSRLPRYVKSWSR
jgi:hypothetical protein